MFLRRKTMLSMLATAAMVTGLMSAPANADVQALPNMQDQSHIVLTGKVGQIDGDEFELIYGNNSKITVELDRFGFTGDETKRLTPGESVTVTGYLDDDLFEGREIEAYNIRMNDSRVYYYTTESQPVYRYTYDPYAEPEEGAFVTMKGTVSDVKGDEFTVSDGNNRMKVDVSEIGYDPFDDEGFQKIENGDEVYIYGTINDSFYESREIMASGLIEMQKRTRM